MLQNNVTRNDILTPDEIDTLLLGISSSKKATARKAARRIYSEISSDERQHGQFSVDEIERGLSSMRSILARHSSDYDNFHAGRR